MAGIGQKQSWVPAVDLAAEDRGEVAIGRHVEEGAQFEACCHEVTHRTEGHVDDDSGVTLEFRRRWSVASFTAARAVTP